MDHARVWVLPPLLRLHAGASGVQVLGCGGACCVVLNIEQRNQAGGEQVDKGRAKPQSGVQVLRIRSARVPARTTHEYGFSRPFSAWVWGLGVFRILGMVSVSIWALRAPKGARA